MPPQTLFLTGAPASSSLVWDSANLLETFTVPVARFAGLSPSVSITATHSSSGIAEPRHASWRSLDVNRQHLPTGHSQGYIWTQEYQGDADFFTTSNISFASSCSDLDTLQLLGNPSSGPESIEDVLSQFYEHSFHVHTTTASSHIALTLPDPNAGTSFASIDTSFTSKTDSLSEDSMLERLLSRPPIPVGSDTTDLRDIPNAKYLDSIQPQTMTVDIIVGIISAAPPRAIKTRRGSEVEIVELLVGDDTKSGFGVNFWLSARSNNRDGGQGVDDIRTNLASIRPQDIVLLRNVALSNFRGKVYGQSLKKEMTKLHLLYRNRIDRTDVGGYYTAGDFDTGKELHYQLTKTMRVRDWVLRFVAPGAFRKAGKEETKVITESLPLDTQ
jgi:hypothetical protein